MAHPIFGVYTWSADPSVLPKYVLTVTSGTGGALILQIAWAEFTKEHKDKLSLFPLLYVALSDAVIMRPLQKYKISPAAWASKAARHHVLENAQDEIIICQQALVQTMAVGRPEIKEVLDVLKSLDVNLDWDGSIMPFDMMFSLCRGILNISKKYPNDDSARVSVLLSTKNDAGGYGDPASWTTFRATLIQMLGLITPRSGIPGPTKFIKERVRCKRIMGNSGFRNHTKMVCVDKGLLYVGSDNIYPQANMQHGVWIEDKKNLGAWYDSISPNLGKRLQMLQTSARNGFVASAQRCE